MEANTKKSMHPLAAIAAISLTLFSLAGIGAITGLIPTSHGTQALQARTADEAAIPAAAAQPAKAATVVSIKTSVGEPAARKVAVRRVKPVEPAARPIDEPVLIAQAPQPLPQYPPAAAPVRPLCYDCGVIDSVREIEKKGEASGAGAAVGGVAGGILGRQAGNGRGRDVMTVLGAIGGAVAGHAIEKNTKKVKSYEIDIRFEDGSSRLITQDQPPVWRSGDKVKLVNGVITANNNY